MGGLSILCAVGCGLPDQVFVQFQSQSRISGGFYSQGQTVEFLAENPAPLVADVKLTTDSLRFDAHFDYATGVVVLDGHGGALDQPSHALLVDAVEARALSIGADLADLPLEQKALYTALVSWEQSGGIPIDRLSIAVDRSLFAAREAVALSAPSAESSARGEPSSSSSFPNGAEEFTRTSSMQTPRGISALALDVAADPPELSRAAGGDAIRCVSRGQSYAVSYDAGSSMTDEIDTVGAQDCNGSCSPGCLQLTPDPMWTIACLAYDACCRASGGDGDCWAPEGECADEYEKAMADFVRGLDPTAPHCPG
ncbi:MAG TPA: hypothetical protein VG963_30030 [Polyangiaceae bacterium]|nr:hypothetical protein [Polyangiaceae bacterium]